MSDPVRAAQDMQDRLHAQTTGNWEALVKQRDARIRDLETKVSALEEQLRIAIDAARQKEPK